MYTAFRGICDVHVLVPGHGIHGSNEMLVSRLKYIRLFKDDVKGMQNQT